MNLHRLYNFTIIIFVFFIGAFFRTNTVNAAKSVDWTKDSNYKLQQINVEEIASYVRGKAVVSGETQGSCIIGNKLVFTVYQSTSSTYLYSIDLDKPEASPRKLANRALGHANDLCYNKSANELYVLHNGYPVYVFSVSGDGINGNISISYKNKITSNSWISGMAKDANKNIFYGQNLEGYFIKFASTITSKVTQIVKPYIEGKLVTQGMAYYNNYLYSVYFEFGKEGADKGYQESQYNESEKGSALIAKYSTGKTFEKNIYVPKKQVAGSYAEIEDIDFRSDGTMILVYNVTVSGSVRYVKIYRVKSGVQQINGNIYYVSKSGDYESGIKSSGNDIYYFGSNYKPLTGWQTIQGNTYYFGADYKAYKGEKKINNEVYYFNENSGIMQKNVKHGDYWFGTNGKGIKDINKPVITINFDNSPTNKTVPIKIEIKENETSLNMVTLDGKNIELKNNIYIYYAEDNGSHRVIAKDIAGNTALQDFIISNIYTVAPTISGVQNGKTYYKKVTPQILSQNDVSIKLTKNGNILNGYKNGQEIIGAGVYKLEVTDNAGNSANITFSIYEIDFSNYVEQKISNDNFNLRKVQVETKASDIIKCLKNVNIYTITRNGKIIYSNENTNDINLATGDILTFESLKYTIIISGDVNKDGKVNNSDVLALLRHIYAMTNNKQVQWNLSGERFLAGDINQSNEIKQSTVIKVLRYIAAKNSSGIAKKHTDWLDLR